MRLLRLALACVGVSLLRLTARRRGLVLVYHALAETAGDPRREVVAPHAASAVELQLRHLRRWYRVVDAREILDAVRSRRRGARFPAAVTFDDDLASHVTVALPLLERLGVHATFFLCGASLETPFTFWWERLQRAADTADPRLVRVVPEAAGEPLPAAAEAVKRRSPAERDALAAALEPPAEWESGRGLRAGDVRRLAASRAIGFHTRRHHPLDRLDDEQLAAALDEGRSELAAVAGETDQVAYPHGAADVRVAAAARAAGFALGFVVGGRAVRADTADLLVPRIVPTYGGLEDFAVGLLRRIAAA